MFSATEAAIAVDEAQRLDDPLDSGDTLRDVGALAGGFGELVGDPAEPGEHHSGDRGADSERGHEHSGEFNCRAVPRAAGCR